MSVPMPKKLGQVLLLFIVKKAQVGASTFMEVVIQTQNVE